jgi:branched-chain amino acid transport system permease protein
MTMSELTTRAGVTRLASTAGLPLVAVLVAAGILIPFVAGGSYLFTWTAVAIWGLFALGTNVLFGWTGLLSFGQTAFFGIGAYSLAILHQEYPGIPGPLLLIAGGVIAAVVGAIFAMGALRSSGAEFAVLTLVLAQVLWLLTYRVPGLKGDDGFAGLYDIKILGGSTLDTDLSLWYYVIVVVGVCAWLLWMLHKSSLGTAMRAVRDDPWRAAALGIRVRGVQIAAFSIGAGFSAVAGGLMAQHQGVVSPSLLSLTISGEVLVACLVGGLRVFGGPLLGAVVLIMSQELLSGMTGESDLFVGVLLLAIVLVLPSGLSSLPGQLNGLRRDRSRPDRTPPPEAPTGPTGTREPEAVNR